MSEREELRAIVEGAARLARARLGRPPRRRRAPPQATAAPAAGRAARGESVGAAAALAEVEAVAARCRMCRLCEGRTTVVFGVGSPAARLMVIGEGPGEEEDKQGIPFVGRAGQLLTRMLAAIDLRRDDVYITNVVKCRPPGNRNPMEDEIAVCEPYLLRQIEIIRPDVLFLLGNHAAKTLLGVEGGITKVRGRLFRYEGILCVPSYHPAYLLRSPGRKGESWEDLKIVRAALDGRLDAAALAAAAPARPRRSAGASDETPSLFG